MNLGYYKLILGLAILIINNCLAAACFYGFYRIFKQGSRKLLSFLNSLYATSAGVILGLFFLGILPTINEHFDKVLKHQCGFALYAKNLAPIGGFLLVWLIDEVIQIVYNKCISARSSEEKEPLSPSRNDGLDIKDANSDVNKEETSHSHNECGSVFLAIALGSHAFLEGFGVGVVTSLRLVITLGSAIGFHEWICIATLSHKFATSNTESLSVKVVALLAYSSIVPVGIFIGVAASGSIGSVQLVVVLSIVGGALLFASIVETLPIAMRSGLPHILILAAFAVGILLIFTFQSVAVMTTINSKSCGSVNLTRNP